MQSKNNLCFDVGGMGIKVILFEDEKVIKEDYLEHIEFEKGGNTKLIDIISKISNYITQLGITTNVGISFPGIIDSENGKVLTKSFLQEIENVDIYEHFSKNPLVSKIVIENDAKAAALGEFNSLSLGINNAFVVTVGSAVGGALILNKKIYTGKTGLAGEISKCYSNLQEESDKVAAHVASTMYLQRCYAKAKKINLDEISGKIVMDNYEAGDKDAKFCVNNLVNALARLILNIQVILEVDCFLIGGGISSNATFMQLLKEKIYHYFSEQELLPYLPIIEVCKLKNKAGCFGMMYKSMEVYHD